MAGSQSRREFDASCEDVDTLLHIAREHELQGIPDKAEVLSKSAIVLITALWEAYCEDIAAEGLQHLVDHVTDPSDLPKQIRKDLATDLKQSKNELAVWALAGDGWKQALHDRLKKYTSDRNRHLNTPKPAQVDELFLKALGITRMSDSWKLAATKTSKKRARPVSLTPDQARKKLTDFIELRGDIAHRGSTIQYVTVLQAERYYELVKILVAKTGGTVNRQVKTTTGQGLFI